MWYLQGSNLSPDPWVHPMASLSSDYDTWCFKSFVQNWLNSGFFFKNKSFFSILKPMTLTQLCNGQISAGYSNWQIWKRYLQQVGWGNRVTSIIIPRGKTQGPRPKDSEAGPITWLTEPWPLCHTPCKFVLTVWALVHCRYLIIVISITCLRLTTDNLKFKLSMTLYCRKCLSL